jgi:branched-subunit amino acid transport protein AzlD
MDIMTYLMQVTNVLAALFGAAVVIVAQRFVPPVGLSPQVVPMPKWVGIANRLLPFLAILMATLMTMALEKISALSFCRGVVAGLLSEQIVRIWYKTVAGV